MRSSGHTVGENLSPRGWRPSVPLTLVALAIGITTGIGCRPPAAVSPTSNAPPDAEQVLHEMIAVYRQATEYEDHAVVRLIYHRNGVLYEDEVASSVRFQRPNRLMLNSNQLTISVDGAQVTARLIDPPSNHLDGQVLSVAAPEQLTPDSVYGLDSLIDAAVRSSMTGYPVQFDLLTAAQPLDPLLSPSGSRELLEPATIERRRCHRVAVSGTLGRFVFWIDEQNNLLRRLEYPGETFAPDAARDPAVTGLSLAVDFRNAAWALSNRGSFGADLPDNARLVRTFMSPPAPLPSPLLGQVPSAFSFFTLDDIPLDRDGLAEHIVVLAWFNEHPACRVTLEQLERIAREMSADGTAQDRIRFYGVATIPSASSHAQVAALARDWNLTIPVVRDLQACGRDVFQIPGAPTVIVLDGRGKIQFFEVGANPDLAGELPDVLKRLIAGEDVAAARREQFQRDRTDYESAISRGGPPPESRQSRSADDQGDVR